jgi:hypothetical protein
MSRTSIHRFVAGALSLSACVACAHAGSVGTDFAPTIPVARIEVEDGKSPSRSKEREAALELEGKRYAARIKVRGSSSAYYPKKQFSLNLREGDAHLAVGLLGMGEASSWVLASPYADKTLVKNVLGLAQARQLFPYAPDTRWVELILDGEYHGVYTLTERIERGKHKVNVPSVEQGGFILAIDAGDTPYIESEQGTQYTLVYPKERDEVSAPVMEELARWLSAFEASLPTENYTQYVHVESFIDYFLQEELWKNIDGFRKSMYLHRAADGKVHLGPSWDFDLGAAGLNFYGGAKPEGWRHADLHYVLIHDPVPWFNELLRHPEYRQKVIARWQELRRPGALFSEARIRAMIDDNVQILSTGPAARNFARWKVIGRVLFPVVFFTVFPIYESWEQEVWRAEKFLVDRANWIDSNIEGIGRFETGKLTY